MSGQQVYNSLLSGRKYHFLKPGWEASATARCSMNLSLDLPTAVDPENVAVDERCQCDGCRQQWDVLSDDAPSAEPSDVDLAKLYRLIQLTDALDPALTSESEQTSLSAVAALDDRTVADLVRMIRRARGIQ